MRPTLCKAAYAALTLMLLVAEARADRTARPPVRHMAFDDDQVEGDLVRADDAKVLSRTRSQFGPLIRLRLDFLPELLRSAE